MRHFSTVQEQITTTETLQSLSEAIMLISISNRTSVPGLYPKSIFLWLHGAHTNKLGSNFWLRNRFFW